MLEEFVRCLRNSQGKVTNTRRALEALGLRRTPIAAPEIAEVPPTQHVRKDIYKALFAISQPLADTYAQVKLDLENNSRLSWLGSAHEIREVLRTVLDTLAPDEKVTPQTWYRQEKNTSGPTQKQRVRYILRARGAGSKEQEVAELVASLEEMIENLVRATYSRASDAAHRGKDRREVRRIVNYFEAFAHDLLDLD